MNSSLSTITFQNWVAITQSISAFKLALFYENRSRGADQIAVSILKNRVPNLRVLI